MNTTQPSPGAMNAAREIWAREMLGIGKCSMCTAAIAAIIDRHAARPDVDELVKALNKASAEISGWRREYDDERSRHGTDGWYEGNYEPDYIAEALTLTRARAQNGGGL